jgi:3-polyprenyl-4-hydroxybenzoate decarboxylase
VSKTSVVREISSGSNLRIDATNKLPGEGLKRPWPQFIRKDTPAKMKLEKFVGSR